MYAIFTAKQAEITRKRKKIESLERKLILDGYDKEDALRDGKDHLTNNMLELLRTRMVHIYLNIQQQKHKIARLAGMLSHSLNDFTNHFAISATEISVNILVNYWHIRAN